MTARRVLRYEVPVDDQWHRIGQRAFAFVLRALAAADAHDRANSIARIRLDDELAEKIAQAIHDDECSGIHDANDCWTECPEWERDIYRRNARAVLDLLRGEAL